MALRFKALVLIGVVSLFFGYLVRVQFRYEPDCLTTPTDEGKMSVKTDKNNLDRTQTAIPNVVLPVTTGDWNHKNDVVMGLVRYDHDGSAQPPWSVTLRMFVGTLRHTGYIGRIVLFVHPIFVHKTNELTSANKQTLEYLLSHNVELVAVEGRPCELPFKTEATTMEIRKLCTTEYPQLQLEWARFALARDWLKNNPNTGWALITDVRDAYFQRPPFADLGPSSEVERFMIFEEFYGDPNRLTSSGKNRGIDTSHWFAKMVTQCYGEEPYKEYRGKPMLCSGQLLGTRSASIKGLTLYVDEMLRNTRRNAACVPPKLPDQSLINYMAYHHKLGNLTIVPYGEGPVLTIGGTCTSNGPKHKSGLRDMLKFDNDKFILDTHNRRAPMVHQWDRCGSWLEKWIRKYVNSFGELHLEPRWATADEELPQDDLVVEPYISSNGDKWIHCGSENDICNCKIAVRFGDIQTDKWTQIDASSFGNKTLKCNNKGSGGIFNDPAIGRPKECQCHAYASGHSMHRMPKREVIKQLRISIGNKDIKRFNKQVDVICLKKYDSDIVSEMCWGMFSLRHSHSCLESSLRSSMKSFEKEGYASAMIRIAFVAASFRVANQDLCETICLQLIKNPTRCTAKDLATAVECFAVYYSGSLIPETNKQTQQFDKEKHIQLSPKQTHMIHTAISSIIDCAKLKRDATAGGASVLPKVLLAATRLYLTTALHPLLITIEQEMLNRTWSTCKLNEQDIIMLLSSLEKIPVSSYEHSQSRNQLLLSLKRTISTKLPDYKNPLLIIKKFTAVEYHTPINNRLIVSEEIVRKISNLWIQWKDAPPNEIGNLLQTIALCGLQQRLQPWNLINLLRRHLNTTPSIILTAQLYLIAGALSPRIDDLICTSLENGDFNIQLTLLLLKTNKSTKWCQATLNGGYVSKFSVNENIYFATLCATIHIKIAKEVVLKSQQGCQAPSIRVLADALEISVRDISRVKNPPLALDLFMKLVIEMLKKHHSILLDVNLSLLTKLLWCRKKAGKKWGAETFPICTFEKSLSTEGVNQWFKGGTDVRYCELVRILISMKQFAVISKFIESKSFSSSLLTSRDLDCVVYMFESIARSRSSDRKKIYLHHAERCRIVESSLSIVHIISLIHNHYSLLLCTPLLIRICDAMTLLPPTVLKSDAAAVVRQLKVIPTVSQHAVVDYLLAALKESPL